MKTSKEMQKLVTNLCEKMKCNLNSDNAHLKVQLDQNHLELDIRRVSPFLVTVSHPFTTSDGEIKVDPEVTFYTLYSQWIPIEITQINSTATSLGQVGEHRSYAVLSTTGKYIKHVEFERQKDLATFVKSWFNALKADGWVNFAQDTAYAQISMDRALPGSPTLKDIFDELGE
jgi:hypothetical protein